MKSFDQASPNLCVGRGKKKKVEGKKDSLAKVVTMLEEEKCVYCNETYGDSFEEKAHLGQVCHLSCKSYARKKQVSQWQTTRSRKRGRPKLMCQKSVRRCMSERN